MAAAGVLNQDQIKEANFEAVQSTFATAGRAFMIKKGVIVLTEQMAELQRVPTPARAWGGAQEGAPRLPGTPIRNLASGRRAPYPPNGMVDALLEESAESEDQIGEGGVVTLDNIASYMVKQTKRTKERDKIRHAALQNVTHEIGTMRSEVRAYQSSVRRQFAEQSQKLEKLQLEQIEIHKEIQTGDQHLQKQIDQTSAKCDELEKHLKKLESAHTSGMTSGTSAQKAGPTSIRHRPELFVVSQFCDFSEKDDQGADYEVAEGWRAAAVKIFTDEKNTGLAEIMGRTSTEMKFPGSALAFWFWLAEGDRDRCAELVAALSKHLSKKELSIKGRQPKKVSVQTPEITKTRQRKAGEIKAGLDFFLEQKGQQYVSNVFFGGSFSILIGKLPAGAAANARPTVDVKSLGHVSSEGLPVWNEQKVQDFTGVTGEELVSKGIEIRALPRNS